MYLDVEMGPSDPLGLALVRLGALAPDGEVHARRVDLHLLGVRGADHAPLTRGGERGDALERRLDLLAGGLHRGAIDPDAQGPQRVLGRGGIAVGHVVARSDSRRQVLRGDAHLQHLRAVCEQHVPFEPLGGSLAEGLALEDERAATLVGSPLEQVRGGAGRHPEVSVLAVDHELGRVLLVLTLRAERKVMRRLLISLRALGGVRC
mmetsp:Transcript_62955/g.151950  ORF Transcript_62955/g.151950 Transcript_62955/m.151950 type:complete len:206 (-) Transcript_62955:239-856(-)